MIPMHYTFGDGSSRIQKYKDGTTVPHLELTIFANGQRWGYVEVHLHKVKVEEREIDISVGTTVRINPTILTT